MKNDTKTLAQTYIVGVRVGGDGGGGGRGVGTWAYFVFIFETLILQLLKTRNHLLSRQVFKSFCMGFLKV